MRFIRELAFAPLVLPLLAVLGVLAGCAAPTITQHYDALTGTTIQQRCAARAAALETLKAQPEYAGSEVLQRVARYDELWITSVCPPPLGLAPVPQPAAPPAPAQAPPTTAPTSAPSPLMGEGRGGGEAAAEI